MIDESGEWLSKWWHECQHLQIDVMRTPSTLHPSPSPDSLRSFAVQRKRSAELIKYNHGDIELPAVPTARLLRDFCFSRIIKNLPSSVQTIHPDSVVDIQPIETEKNDNSTNHNTLTPEEIDRLVFGTPQVNKSPNSNVEAESVAHRSEGLKKQHAWVYLKSGRKLPASAIIVSFANRKPVVPSWARLLLNTNSSADFELKKALITWDNVDLEASNAKEIAIVGGGMMAATLALGALASGCKKVTMIARRHLKCCNNDCDVGWWGNKRLNAFWHETDPEERMKWCRRARPQATIHPAVWSKLAQAAATGKLIICEGKEIKSISEQNSHTHTNTNVADVTDSNSCSDSGTRKWHVALHCTEGFKPDRLEESPNQDSDFARYVAQQDQTFHEISRFSGDLNTNGTENSSKELGTASTVVDEIWLACGSAFNASNIPIFSSKLLEKCPNKFIAGYPILDCDTCLWPGAPLYIIGAGSMLAVGPAAGSLAGQRLAADRIVNSLKRSQLDGSMEKEIDGSMTRIISQFKRLESKLLDKDEAEKHGIYLALEEEGKMFVEPKFRPKITRPAHLVDVSDLPDSLAKHEIQRFLFSDEDFEICVVLQLPESVDSKNVRTVILERSLDVWCIGTKGAYRLHVPRLYGRILPDRCRIKVKPEKRKVILVLYKESDTEWKFLKG